jgi:hypothetical protein
VAQKANTTKKTADKSGLLGNNTLLGVLVPRKTKFLPKREVVPQPVFNITDKMIEISNSYKSIPNYLRPLKVGGVDYRGSRFASFGGPDAVNSSFRSCRRSSARSRSWVMRPAAGSLCARTLKSPRMHLICIALETLLVTTVTAAKSAPIKVPKSSDTELSNADHDVTTLPSRVRSASSIKVSPRAVAIAKTSEGVAG